MKNPRPYRRTGIPDPYHDTIRTWLEEDGYYTATWIYDRLVNQGYSGSYETVKRKVGKLKNHQQKTACMRFETDPGHQTQVDFGDFQVELPDGIIKKLYLFSMIPGYSRKIYTELIEKCDMPGFPDCHIHAFEYFGGVPDQILYDRMKNVYITRMAGKHKFNSTLAGFAFHYGFVPKVAPAYAARVKGKVERPCNFIREGCWRGYGYVDLITASKNLWSWIIKKDERIHGTTHEKTSTRFKREQPCLNSMPHQLFDTSCRIYRKDCTVHFDCSLYVLPHRLVGARVILRVKDGQLRIFENNDLIAICEIPPTRGNPVRKKRFYEDLQKDMVMNRRKYHHGKKGKGRAKQTISPQKPEYDMDVGVRSIVMDRIESNLLRLKLSRIHEISDSLARTAGEQKKSCLSFLDELLEGEVAAKEQSRIETALKISGLPYIKSIDDFDFTFQAGLAKQKIMGLFDLNFIRQKGNVILPGPPGAGRTHLAVSPALKACQAGMGIYFTNMENLIIKLRKDHEAGKPGKGRGCYKSSLVVVDEVGYTPITREECNLFFRFIANRYEKNSTIVTSNKAFGDWTGLFHDPVIVTAIPDRLLHHGAVINIKGNSYSYNSTF